MASPFFITSPSAGPGSGNRRRPGRRARVRIGDGAVLCAGAVVLFGDDGMTIGAGTVLAANAVLTCSTGPGEIWAGAPARKIADRASLRRPP